MPRSLGTALGRVNRLANRLRLNDKPDPAKMSDEELCADTVELSLNGTGRQVRNFRSYEEFVDAMSAFELPSRTRQWLPSYNNAGSADTQQERNWRRGL